MVERACTALTIGAVVVAWGLAGGAAAWTGTAASYAVAPMCSLQGPVPVAVPAATRPGEGDSTPWSAVKEAAVCPPPPQLGTDEPITTEDARKAFQATKELAAQGRPEEALLNLEVVAQAYPELADRIALQRADLLLAAGRPKDACRAFKRAGRSLDTNTRVRARVGLVRCLIAADDPSAESALWRLQRSYPHLPIHLELQFDLAHVEEQAGHLRTAARMYRDIDQSDPASGFAARARARLEALGREGVHLYALPIADRVDRLERLADSAPPEQVRKALLGFDHVFLQPALRARVTLVRAKVAREECRWGEALKYFQQARWTGALPDDVDPRDIAWKTHDLADALDSRDPNRAVREIRQLKGWRPYLSLPVPRLLMVLDVAIPAGQQETIDQVLQALDKKRTAPRNVLRAATAAMGAGTDEVVATVLSHLVDDPGIGVAARYFYARTLERMHRWTEAELQLVQVRDDDDSSLGWYRMWAQLRLRKVHEQMVGHCGPDDFGIGMSAAASAPGLDELGQACTASLPEQEEAAEAERPIQLEGMHPSQAAASGAAPATGPVDTSTLASRLRPVADDYGDVFPWLPRALDLLELGDRAGASDELHDAFLAWRSATGKPVRRAGLLAVYSGEDLPRPRASWPTLVARRKLDAASEKVLSDVAEGLGDIGVSVGFANATSPPGLPRAYRDQVVQAARRYGLDPNLLFAVMRVESAYQRRIVSYAGAIGLMQIMPRTAQLIADEVDRYDFTTDQLLDPRTSLDLSAWYLASLIKRFDGRLPLAIASYNGGPHNVRRWLEDYAPGMPVDAFLEHIPFSQTFRYVRRVLTYYAAYRAQKGLPMEQLATRLPQLGPDDVGF